MNASATSSLPRRRWLFITIGLLAVSGLVVWVLATGHEDTSLPDGTARNSATGQMAGMPAMGAEGSVTLTADQIRTFGITYGTVERRQLATVVRTAGVVAFDETRVSQVTPKIGGFVEQLHVDFTGQPVRRGQPLLELYSPDLVAAQQELLLAAQLQRSVGSSAVPGFPSDPANLVAAARRRFALWDISDRQVDEILRTGRVRRTLTLFAPTSGIVVEKKVVSGQSVMSGEHLYTIADVSRVWIETELRVDDAADVRVGSAADIDVAGLPGRSFKGRVEYVYPTVQPEARTIRARIAVSNGDGVLKPGMYATVRLSSPSETVVAVPNSAVIRTGERTIVFVDMGGGQLMAHDVTLGRVAEEFTEVLDGVDEGARVVTSAQFLIDSESNLAEVMRSMIGQTGASDAREMSDMPGMNMPGMTGDSSPQKMPASPAPRR
jgi:multidrug efflux pump subunit AcrA (membrane-fusion protein)